VYLPVTCIVMHGDVHLTSRAALGLFPYTHFGVEMQGGGMCENSLAGVRIVSLPDFARGGATRVRNPAATAAERALAVERAASRIGERRYSLTANNCEHFANWCATGAAVSHQVIAFIAALARMVLAAAVSLLAVSLARATLAE
jgi:lecithin:retinol acyltransferase